MLLLTETTKEEERQMDEQELFTAAGGQIKTDVLPMEFNDSYFYPRIWTNVQNILQFLKKYRG